MSTEPDRPRSSWAAQAPAPSTGPAAGTRLRRRAARPRESRPTALTVLATLALDVVGIVAAVLVVGLVLVGTHPRSNQSFGVAAWTTFLAYLAAVAAVGWLLRCEGRPVLVTQAVVLVVLITRFALTGG